MNRLKKEKKAQPYIRVLIPLAIFLIILTVFFSGLSSVSHATQTEEQKHLEEYILQSAVHCYALEGFYPDSLDYLERHYGIRYDKNKYIVSYEIMGSNLMPDVTVIPLKDKEGLFP